MFLSRPHGHVGSDIGFIMDRGQLTKQGMKIQPFSEAKYGKVINDGSNIFFKGKPKSNAWWRRQKDLWGKDVIEELTPHGLEIKPARMNPRFEFEERVRGYIPTENVSLIDLARLPSGQSVIDVARYKTLIELAKSKTPIIKSFKAKEGLQKTLSDIRRSRLGKGKPVSQYLKEQGVDTQDYIQATEQLLNTPTYRFDPFSKLQ